MFSRSKKNITIKAKIWLNNAVKIFTETRMKVKYRQDYIPNRPLRIDFNVNLILYNNNSLYKVVN